MNIFETIAKELKITVAQVENTAKLIDEGNTIPFIARYRKEVHGSLDDQMLRTLADRLTYLRNLEDKKQEVFDLIDKQEKMTPEIEKALKNAKTLSEIEDIYRPYRPKRKTRASVAKEKGLEPLAVAILKQEKDSLEPLQLAQEFVDSEKGVKTPEDALQGAMDIIAEQVSDDPEARKFVRTYLTKNALIATTAAKAEEKSVYEMYYDFTDKVEKIASHRVLAINRGEKEGFLKVSLQFDKQAVLTGLYNMFVLPGSKCTKTVMDSVDDSFDRLIFPSVEREIRALLTENASESAIGLFGTNLSQLLMQPPVRNKVTLGFDPAYRTGCKIAVVDETGKVLTTTVIYPTKPQMKTAQSEKTLLQLIEKYNVEVIAIGNGTASKESEIFVADTLKKTDKQVSYMVVSEAGASVYSASKLAAEEFPQFDVSLRSAVSIARRLQDPLAELVKIDPKAIGVGQYQHDMPKKQLEGALNGVVEDCVNSVGVDLNTASPSLLKQVAGLSSAVAQNIVTYREENGTFNSRKEVLKVNKLGNKAFEQAAGFLRVVDGKNVLDNTGVHPESYKAAEELLKLAGYTLTDVKNGNIGGLKDFVESNSKSELADKMGVGVPTLNDIVDDLLKPGRDPRDSLPQPVLRSDVLDIKDLTVGMKLTGTVRNVIDFGAFVDIGVHVDGLIHLSKLAKSYVKHPLDVVKVGDILEVTVISVDVEKKRIGLSLVD